MPGARGAGLPAVALTGALGLAGTWGLAACAGSIQIRLGGAHDCARDFGSSTAAQKIETYLAASAALSRDAAALRCDLDAACRSALRAGAEAGSPAELGASRSTGAGAESSPCGALASWLVDEVVALDVGVSLELTEPTCSRSRPAFATCVSRCELRYRPDDIEVTLDAEGALSAPQASPRCRASCETLSALEAECTAPTVTLAASGQGPATDAERLERLRRVWEQHGPAIAAAAARAERVSRAASRLLEIAPVLPEAAATISIRAVACASAARSDVALAEEQLRSVASEGRSVTHPQLR